MVQHFLADYLKKDRGDLNEEASDKDDAKDDDDDDDDANSKDDEVAQIGTGEILIMLDSLVNLKYLSKEERVLNKKQSHISDYFMLEYIFYDRFYQLIFHFKTLQVPAI